MYLSVKVVCYPEPICSARDYFILQSVSTFHKLQLLNPSQACLTVFIVLEFSRIYQNLSAVVHTDVAF